MLSEIEKKKVRYEQDHRITVGKLRERLREFSADTEVIFGSCTNGNHLIFYRVKQRGDLAQIELNEVTKELLDS